MKKAVNVGSALKGPRYLGAAGKRVVIKKKKQSLGDFYFPTRALGF